MVIRADFPNLVILFVNNSFAAISVVMSEMDIVSGHLENRSIIIRQYLYPREVGIGPTILT